MDEPTTALDVVVQRDILQLISALCKEFSYRPDFYHARPLVAD